MTIAITQIENLAPDQASLAAAAKLKKPALWPLLARDDAGLIWGECQGSGSSPYRVMCSEADLGYKCTCPSRKFPCKHTLALMWMQADGKLPFRVEAPPDWVGDWLARRRPGTAPSRKDNAGAPAAGASAAAAVRAEAADEAAPEDPKAAARAAAARERNKAEREAAILGGLDELDTWIADALQGGLASFMPAADERSTEVRHDQPDEPDHARHRHRHRRQERRRQVDAPFHGAHVGAEVARRLLAQREEIERPRGSEQHQYGNRQAQCDHAQRLPGCA